MTRKVKFDTVKVVGGLLPCLFIVMLFSQSADATLAELTYGFRLLQAIEANSVELRLQAAPLKPFLDYLIGKLVTLMTHIIGYEEELINIEHSQIERCAFEMKQRAGLTANALKCIDGNLALARQVTNKYRMDSTCLRQQNKYILSILQATLPALNGDPLGPCPMPVACVILRPGIESLMVSLKALTTLLLNSLRLTLALLRYNPTLQACRSDVRELKISHNIICNNCKMCQYLVI